MTVALHEIQLSDPRWITFARSHEHALPFHHPAWAGLLSDCYRYRGLVLALCDGHGDIVAGLPALEVRRPFGARRYVCLPFTDFCPVLALSEQQAILTRAIVEAGSAGSLDEVEVRAALPVSDGLHVSTHGVRHVLALSDDLSAVERQVSKHHRRNIRRAEQSDVTVRFGTTVADMATFYQLHLLTRQRLGLPVQPRKFFRLLADTLERDQLGFVLIAYRGTSPIAAAVFLTWQNVMIYKYGASDSTFWDLRPNNLLFWNAIRWGCEHGFRLLDWGRTEIDSRGLREFKSGWGAREEPLLYSAIGKRVPNTGPGRLQRAMTPVLRRSPTWVCRAMGEALYRYAA